MRTRAQPVPRRVRAIHRRNAIGSCLCVTARCDTALARAAVYRRVGVTETGDMSRDTFAFRTGAAPLSRPATAVAHHDGSCYSARTSTYGPPIGSVVAAHNRSCTSLWLAPLSSHGLLSATLSPLPRTLTNVTFGWDYSACADGRGRGVMTNAVFGELAVQGHARPVECARRFALVPVASLERREDA